MILPVYNAESTLKRAIWSVESQTMQDWEIIAVDDASTDHSYRLLIELSEHIPNLRVYQNSTNLGAGITRANAIELATGRYIAFLDSDDEWLSAKLEKQIGFMKKANSAFSCTAYYTVKNGNRDKTIHVPREATRDCLLKNNTVGSLTAIYDADHFDYVNLPDLRLRCDYALWLDLLQKTDAVHGLDEPLAIYHKTNTSLSANKFKCAALQWKFYRDYLQMGFLKTMWYFGHYANNASRRNFGV